MIRMLRGMCVLGHEKHVPTLTSPDLWIILLLCGGHSRNANDHMDMITRIMHTIIISTCWRKGTKQQLVVVH